jgi:hypothetical protein
MNTRTIEKQDAHIISWLKAPESTGYIIGVSLEWEPATKVPTQIAALISCQARAWRYADESLPPFGEGRHARGLRRVRAVTEAALRRIRVASAYKDEYEYTDGDGVVRRAVRS